MTKRATITLFCFALALGTLLPLRAETLWRIGRADDSGAEFTGGKNPDSFEIPEDWESREEWPEWRSGSSGAPPVGSWWNSRIAYTLEEQPEVGVEFTLKTVNAGGMVPEVAVFSNGVLAGILQIVGARTPNQGNPRSFGSTYGVYIPRDFLQAGENELRLEKVPPIYNRDAGNRIYLDIDWDYFELKRMTELPDTPLHSRRIFLGSVYGSFAVDKTQVDTVGDMWEWLGVAYSGNPIRASFWSNLGGQTHRKELLQRARDYRMSPVLAFLTDKNSANEPRRWIDEEGGLRPHMQRQLDQAWREWGSLIQFYELSNEPGMSITNGSFAVNLALARYIQATKPDHVKLAAPGYAFGGGHGDPVNWTADPYYRRQIAKYCDLIGGHTYGRSFFKTPGGIISETIDTYTEPENPRILNGFPKEVLVTETGSHLTAHEDFSNLGLGSSKSGRLRASAYDKVMRANIGFADRILNFSSVGDQDGPFRMLDGSRGDPETWRAAPFPTTGKFSNPEKDTKLGAFRRLALAYATHGRPLRFDFFNREELKDQLVYFRAVDTSSLPPLPGSGATSDKILLNFVNFSDKPQTVKVRVMLPRVWTYQAVRFGWEPAYRDARSEQRITALPHVDLEEELPPFAAVQYILTP